jgi:hypothetical protein
MQLKKLVKSSTAEFGLIIILAAGSCARSKEMLDTLGLEFIESKLATANTSLSSSYGSRFSVLPFARFVARIGVA